MTVVLWILTGLLAAVFLTTGGLKLTRSREQIAAFGWRWVEDMPQSTVKLVAAAELLGALGLILPRVLEVAEFLAPSAAAGLAITMAGAVVVHARRHETDKLATPAVLGAVCVATAVLLVSVPR